MKIVSTGSTLSSSGFAEKKKRLGRRKRILWTLGILILLGFLVFVSRQERFIINEVMVEGTKTVSTDEVETKVKEFLSGYYLWLVPHSNNLLYSRSRIEEGLLSTFSRFNHVGLALEGTNTLRVSVVEREPFALYCDNIGALEYASKCYFLDDTGYIFDKAPEFSGPVYFVHALKEPLVNPLGHEFMKAEEFRPLSQFVLDIKELGVEGLALEAGEGEISLLIPNNAHIVWQRGVDLKVIYSNLKAFLNNESIKEDKDFLEKINLLDLRVENKVFYTFK